MNHRGCIIWLTGLSGSGKSTIATALREQLVGRGERVEVLDGDVIRENLSKGLGFSKEDRDTNILRIGFVAGLLARNGVKVITAAISPYRQTRDQVRSENPDFMEVHVSTPIDICESRDPKNLYAKARAGELKGFTGIDDPYEPPLAPEVELSTVGEGPEQSAATILKELQAHGYVDS